MSLVLPVKVKLELQMAYSFKHKKNDSHHFPKKALVGTRTGLYVKDKNQELHRKMLDNMPEEKKVNKILSLDNVKCEASGYREMLSG